MTPKKVPAPFNPDAPVSSQRLSCGERRFLLAMVAGLLLIHLASAVKTDRLGKTLCGVDGQHYYVILRSMVFDGDFDFTNDFRLTPHPEHIRPGIVPATNKPANKYGVGWALIALVPYLLVHLSLLAGSLFREGFPYTGFEAPYQIAATISQVLAAGAGLILCYLLTRRYWRPAACGASVLLMLLGSPLLYYACKDVHMSHAGSFFAVTLFLYLAVVVAERAARGAANLSLWAALGAAGGLMLVTRYSNLVFVPVLAYPVWTHLRLAKPKDQRRNLRTLVTGGAIALAAALPFLAIQAFLWHSVYDTWLAHSYGQGGEHFLWTRPELLQYLLSNKHGVFFYSPLSLLAWGGLISLLLASHPQAPRLLIAGLVAGLGALTYLNASWYEWWFGWGFGARAYLAGTSILCLGLAAVFSTRRPLQRWTFVALGCMAVIWTNLMCLLLLSHRLAPDGSTAPTEILKELWRMLTGQG